MLQRGKFIVFKSDYIELTKFKDWIIFYIDKDFPLEDMEILHASGMIEVREATEREKKLCYLALEESNENRGIFINELDSFEDYITKTYCKSAEDF